MTIGIYKIVNKINNNTYIGQSKNIEYRWKTHKDDLKDNNHHQHNLQKEYNKLIKEIKLEYKDNELYKFLDFNIIVLDRYYNFEIIDIFNVYDKELNLLAEDHNILKERDIKEGYFQLTNYEIKLGITNVKTCSLTPKYYYTNKEILDKPKTDWADIDKDRFLEINYNNKTLKTAWNFYSLHRSDYHGAIPVLSYLYNDITINEFNNITMFIIKTYAEGMQVTQGHIKAILRLLKNNDLLEFKNNMKLENIKTFTEFSIILKNKDKVIPFIEKYLNKNYIEFTIK